MAIEQLTSDAHWLIVPEFLNFWDPWAIGSELGLLFGGAKQVHRRFGAAAAMAERWRMMQFAVERTYRSPDNLVQADSNGVETGITVSPDVPALTLTLQAYGDYIAMHRPPAEPEALRMSFTASGQAATDIRPGFNWNFTTVQVTEAAYRGTVYATAEQYPERLQIASEAMAVIAGVDVRASEEVVIPRYAPQGFAHLQKVWDVAMGHHDRLRAAQFVLRTYQSV